MYLDEYLRKFGLTFQKKISQKNTPNPIYPKVLKCICDICLNIFIFICSEYQVLIKAQTHSCQLYRIVAICSKSLDRLNKGLFEVLYAIK